MPDIKLRDVVKGTVKTLDRSKSVAEHTKSVGDKARYGTEQSISSRENSAGEYSTNRLQDGIEYTAGEAGYRFRKKSERGIPDAQRNIQEIKKNAKTLNDFRKSQKAKRAAKKATKKTANKSTKQTVKTAKKAGKGTVKTAQKTVKTAKSTGKVAIKTTKTSAKTVKATAKATAKAAKAAIQAAKAAIKALIAAIKVAIKVIAALVKLIIAAVKALIAIIAAGGWIAVVIIIVICVIALIVCSCYGIFFAGEDSEDTITLQNVITEINEDYEDRIEEIKYNTEYDIFELTGNVTWPEVLAVYAVKTTTDTTDPQEVVTMDETKKRKVYEIFWQVNTISYYTKDVTETVITQTDDGHGNTVKTTTTVTKIYLYITVSNKSEDELAAYYGFTEEQKQQLAELLSPSNQSVWNSLINSN